MRVRKHPHSGHTGHARDFIKCVDEMARHRSHRDVFEDFLEMGYCAIAKRGLTTGEQADALEARYMTAVGRGDNPTDYGTSAAHMLAHVTLAMKDETDFLGPIAAELGALNVAAGQFFTPSSVSDLMAEMSLADCKAIVEQRGFITLAEPACGAGAMVLSAAKVIRRIGLHPETCLFVQATDVSATCFKMAYLQLALSNIPAHVICGDTLSGKHYEWAHTPAMLSFIAHHGRRWTNYLAASRQPQAPPMVAPPASKPRALSTSPLARHRRHALQGASPALQIAHRQAAAVQPSRLAVSKTPPNAVDAALSFKRED